MQRVMRFGSVCSGIECATEAWRDLGWEPAFYSEIEKFPRALLKQRHGAVPLHGDFTTIGADDYGAIDVLVGGTPCQDFSVAGLRAGLVGERGLLTLEYFRLAYRKRPRWLVWENVPGVLSLDDGRAFGLILSRAAGYPADAFFEPPADGWRNSGIIEPANGDAFGLAWRVLDAQYFGVPQRRRRLFIVGYLGDWRRAAAVLLERHSLSGHPPPSREARARVTRPIACSSPSSSGNRHDADTAENIIASTLAASNGGISKKDGIAGRVIAFGGNDTRGALEVATALRAKGGTGHGDFESETFIAHALTADGFDTSEDGTGRSTPLVEHAFDARQSDVIQYGDGTGPLDTDGHSIAIAFSAKDRGADATADVAPTLRSMAEVDGNANAGGQVAVAFTVSQQSDGFAWESERYPTLGTKTGGAQQTGLREGMSVRRLTPTECERLQGLPDGYTQITYRGKPAADGPRYKALGNSMARPVMTWIGRRIQAVADLDLQQRSER